MRKNLVDLTGQKFGTLLVLKYNGSITNPGGKKESSWLCKCLNCGKEYSVRNSIIKRLKSCGCLQASSIKTKEDEHIQSVWRGMLSRCRNPNNSYYNDYGKRGISVCEEWHHFRNFQKWCYENGYKIGLTIDRIDNNGNYNPSNCRFITNKEQQRNKRNNRMLKDPFDGEVLCLSALAEKYNIKITTLSNRINRSKLSVYDAITIPIDHSGNSLLYRKRVLNE